MRTLTPSGLVVVLSLLLACFAASAEAQTVSGSLTGATWRRPNTQCNGISPEPGTTRRYTVYTYSITTPGTYTVSATRTSGGSGIYMDVYQPFVGTAGYECVNRWTLTGTGSNAATTTSQTVTQGGPLNGGTVYFSIVISGTSDTDSATFSISVSGPQQVVIQCGSNAPGYFTPSTQSAAPAGGSFSTSFVPSPGAGCSSNWSVSGIPAWVSGFPASGSGASTINYTVGVNSGSARNATLSNSQGGSLSLSQSASTCTYSISPASTTVAGSGGSGSFNITTQAGCVWNTSVSGAWLSGVTASGTGSGSISFTAAANSGGTRAGTIGVAGQTFTVNQSSGCTVSLSPTSASPAAAGSTASFNVTAPAGCAWTASESSAFLSGVTASGTGNGTVSYTVAANNGPARSDSITVTATASAASAAFSVTQASGCSYVMSPTFTSASAAGGNASFSVTTAAGCSWSASESASWISGLTASGTGNGSVSFSVAANTGPTRAADITLNGQAHTVTQASGCAVALSPSSATPGSAGGAASFNVNADPGCAWTTSSASGFLSSITASGTGAGSVGYSVGANSGVARSGTITVTATQTSQSATFTVNQSNGCVYSLSSSSANLGAGAGSTSFALNASNGGCPWTGVSNATWITGVSASGNGTSSVAYTVAANSGPARSGTITAGGLSFTVNQANGCVATLPASSGSVAVGGQSSSFSLSLSAATCPWSASSPASWLSAITPSGTGSGSVSFSAAANVGPARSATINAGGLGFQVNQPSGCVVALPIAAANAVMAGGSSSFSVSTASGCAYTVSSDSPWLTASVGTGGIDYTVSASSGAARVGRLTVQSTSTASSASFQVTQADGCVVMLSASAATLPAAGQSAHLDVNSGAGCSWQATADAAWITDLTLDATGVSYRVVAHDGPRRSALLHVSNGSTGSSADFAVTQESGCSVAVASSPLLSAAGGAQSLTVSTAAGCGLSVGGSASWLSNLNLGGGSLHFDVAQNTGVARSQTLRVSSPDSGAGADVSVSQSSGCAIALPVDMASHPLSGASASFAVNAGQGCNWSASSGDGWIQNLAATATGVSYEVSANAGVARTTLITVRTTDTLASATFAIDQAGAIVRPTILTQPSAVRVEQGSPFELSVVAAGGALSYVWYHDGAPLAGPSGMSFGAAAAQPSDDGSYRVVVSNEAGSVTSDEIEVEVAPLAEPTSDGGLPMGDAGASVDDGGMAGEADAGAGSDSDAGGESDAGGDDGTGGDVPGGDEDGSGDEGPGEARGGAGCSMDQRGAQGGYGWLSLLGLCLVLRRRRAR